MARHVGCGSPAGGGGGRPPATIFGSHSKVTGSRRRRGVAPAAPPPGDPPPVSGVPALLPVEGRATPPAGFLPPSPQPGGPRTAFVSAALGSAASGPPVGRAAALRESRPERPRVAPRAGILNAPARDLEWKIIYVGSAESEEYDQVLDSVLVGPVPAGRHMFVFQADAPNPGLIPDADAVGVTVVLITCTYRGQEFIRVGYYVNNEYTETELRENPPVKPDFSKLQRNILASNPRVTRFHINWEDNSEKLEDAESSNPNLQSLLSTDALPSASKGWSTSENSLNVMLESHMDCM
ncbi:histone chaperone ASF1A isoform X1 [Pezoporus occidentalis]